MDLSLRYLAKKNRNDKSTIVTISTVTISPYPVYNPRHLKSLGNHRQSWQILWLGFTSNSTAWHKIGRISAMHFVLFEWISIRIYVQRKFFGKFCSVTRTKIGKESFRFFLVFSGIFQKFSNLYWLSYAESPSNVCRKLFSNIDSDRNPFE